MNPFLKLGGEAPYPPNELYAYVDQIEPAEEIEGAPRTLRLDCVGANWFDEFRAHEDIWEILPEAPLAMIEVITQPGLGSEIDDQIGGLGNWSRIVFDKTGHEGMLHFYTRQIV